MTKGIAHLRNGTQERDSHKEGLGHNTVLGLSLLTFSPKKRKKRKRKEKEKNVS